MNPYEEKLKTFLRESNSTAEHLSFEVSCHSVQDAAKAANASVDDFVKNICMIGPDGSLIVAIVPGDARASTSCVAKALDIERPRTATPEEILEKTGYPCGGTPSFGYEATFLLDPKVVEKEFIFTGGGSETSLVKIAVQELLAKYNYRVVRVRK